MNSKILPQMCLWTRKNCFNFRSRPHLDLSPEIFKRIIQHCEIRHFLQCGSYLGKTHRIFMKILSSTNLWTGSLRWSLGTHPYPKSRSGLRIQTPDLDQIHGGHPHSQSAHFWGKNTIHRIPYTSFVITEHSILWIWMKPFRIILHANECNWIFRLNCYTYATSF